MHVNRRMLIIPLGVAAFLFLVFVPIVPLTVGPFEKCASGLCLAVPPNAKMLPNGEFVYREIVSVCYYISGFGGVVNGRYYVASNSLTSGETNGILLLFLPLLVAAAGGTILSISGDTASEKQRRQREWFSFFIVLATIFSIFLLLDSGQWVWSWLPITGEYIRPYLEHAIGDAILVACALLAIWSGGIRPKLLRRSNARLLTSIFALLLLFFFVLSYLPGFSGFANTTTFALTVLEYMVFVAFAEELLFRGYIQNFLDRKLQSKHLVVICAAIIFAMFHVVRDLGSSGVYFIVGDMLTQLIGGIIFSYIYLVTDDLAFSIIIHGFYDLAAVDFVVNYAGLETRAISVLLVSLFLIVPFLLIGYARKSRFEQLFRRDTIGNWATSPKEANT